MIATVAKRLRRAAEAATVGMPARAYKMQTLRTQSSSYAIGIVNAPGSTRALYRELKKKYLSHAP